MSPVYFIIIGGSLVWLAQTGKLDLFARIVATPSARSSKAGK